MKRIVVIGGGVSGLTAAYRLSQKGAAGDIEVMLLESSSRLGGIVRTEERNGFLLEHGPDSFISEKPAALELANELGLGSRLVETNPNHRRSFIVRNGRLHAVPEGFQLLAPTKIWPFISSKVFSWPGKLRMALDLLLPRGGSNSDESLASFVQRRLGREALERMAQPMVGGIYTADPAQLSLRATLPRFLEMEESDRSLIIGMVRRGKTQSGTSGARYSLFLSFDRGMQVLTDELARRIPNGSVKLNTTVTGVSFANGPRQWQVKVNGREPIAADSICLAISTPVASRLLQNTNAQLADLLSEIKYESTATINFGYRREQIEHRLDGFGFVVPFIERRSLVACTFSSVKFTGRAPADHVLLRAFVGGALQPDKFALAEDEMSSQVEADLRDLLRIRDAPLFTTVTKWKQSMPQYRVGHLELVKRIDNALNATPSLALAGNGLAGVGIPDCIRSGEVAAARLLSGICADK